MKDETIIKLFAIGALVVLEIANLLTTQYDGAVIGSISAVIGGIAGYEVGKLRGVKNG